MRYIFGDHQLDTERRELRRGDARIALEPQVFDLLVCLLQNRDRVVSKDDLLAQVWTGRIVSDATIDSRIMAARHAIGDSGAAQGLIRTFARKGVRFVATVEEKHKEKPAFLKTSDEPYRLSLPDKPSIAVLPFQNISGAPGQEYFVDGMVEEIITALSRIRWLFVLARNSSFTYKDQAVDVKRVGRELGVRYLLEGSVRKAGKRVRITGQLIEAETGVHLWADRFDGPLEDIFDLQDRVASSVAGVIEPALQAAEIRRSAERPTSDLTAYDLYLRALSHYEGGRVGIQQALDLLGQAIERDQGYGPALALAAHCHQLLDITGWTKDPATNRGKGIDFAQKALRVARDDPDVLGRVAFAFGYFGEDLDAAIALADRARELNPNFALGWFRSGWLRLWHGEPDLAIEHFETSLRLSPRDPIAASFLGIGIAHILTQRFDEARVMLLRSLQESPNSVPTYRWLAVCCTQMGRLDEAREIIGRLRVITPIVPPSASPFRSPEHHELYLSGLRLAAGEEILTHGAGSR